MVLLSLGCTARTTADGDIQLVASQACVSLVKNTHLHMRTYHRKCTQLLAVSTRVHPEELLVAVVVVVVVVGRCERQGGNVAAEAGGMVAVVVAISPNHVCWE